MSASDPAVADLLARWVEAKERTGEGPPVAELCAGRPQLAEPLARALARYRQVERMLDSGGTKGGTPEAAGELPAFPGFRTVERLGRGGMGEVYKLLDPQLGRTVAAKVLRRDVGAAHRYGDFLREARTLALFSDPRIVRIYDYRADAEPPFLVMEHVDGFELSETGPSLSFEQRARVMAEVCGAVERAHRLGIKHRDLKPANILLDKSLAPKILDFGLADSNPTRGHGAGTLAYAAPEQVDDAPADPGRPLDARSDVYALGVTLYELLCGERPYGGDSEAEVLAALRAGRPRLPVEVDPAVPEPLQAIALKAMEPEPARRYATAREMERELRRFLDGLPVLARPSLYASALGRRVRPHLAEIRDWLALKLVYPHEAADLVAAYRRLEGREDDWIVESRRLSTARIALYLGAFLLLAGGLFYFVAHRFYDAVPGLAGPLLVLGLPFAALNVLAYGLERRELPGVAVAFYLGAASLLPLLLLIVFAELGLWSAGEGQFFDGGTVSNRQLQVAAVVACAWTLGLALRTRTVALSSIFAVLGLVFALAVSTDLGLREWIDEGRWDLLALHLAPVLVAFGAAGRWSERRGRPHLATPLYFGGAGLFALLLELLALDGRAFAYLGMTLSQWQPAELSDPTLLDTVGAMTINGLSFYAAAWGLDRSGSELAASAGRLLLVASPFAILEPIAYLNSTGEYAEAYLWLYLALAVAIAFLSQHRQRKSFYYAGILNTGSALLLIADRYEWFDLPAWAVSVLGAGLAALVAGVALEVRERNRRR